MSPGRTRPPEGLVEAPGTAPGSATLIPQSVYRHSQAAPDASRYRKSPSAAPALSLEMTGFDEPHHRTASRDTGAARAVCTDPPGGRAGPGSDPLRGDSGARSRLRPGGRLYGRRLCDRAGGARLLRARDAQGLGRPRPHPLPDAALALDPVRDVRDQIPRETADLRRAPMDPAPHGQRERILRALLRARPRVLHPDAGASRGPVARQPAGPRGGA